MQDTSTAEWMKAFYAGVRSDKDLATAAQEARRTIAGCRGRSCPGWSHPYDWAPFVAMGAER